MEALLSLSFDNLSSRDVTKIKKGLRQIEGLLAQICLLGSRSSSASKRLSLAPTQEQEEQGPRNLEKITKDPAYREFFRLQEGFEGNVASRLIGCLERLLGLPSSRSSSVAE